LSHEEILNQMHQA